MTRITRSGAHRSKAHRSKARRSGARRSGARRGGARRSRARRNRRTFRNNRRIKRNRRQRGGDIWDEVKGVPSKELRDKRKAERELCFSEARDLMNEDAECGDDDGYLPGENKEEVHEKEAAAADAVAAKEARYDARHGHGTRRGAGAGRVEKARSTGSLLFN